MARHLPFLGEVLRPASQELPLKFPATSTAMVIRPIVMPRRRQRLPAAPEADTFTQAIHSK
jgi:hypothetical protein